MKLHSKQYLRYAKTFIWAIKKDFEALQKVTIEGKINDYPVDATTLEDAVTAIETKENLRATNVSVTDLYAIKEALQHINYEKETEPNQSNPSDLTQPDNQPRTGDSKPNSQDS